MDTCRNCQIASHALRRIGLRDNISWGTMGGPNDIIHATFSNAGVKSERPETEEEYKRRRADAIIYGMDPDIIPPMGRIHQEYTLQPLCKFYQSEISWLTAGRPTRTTVYMAHPVSGPRFKENVRNAALWLRYLRHLPQSELEGLLHVRFQQRPLVLCPWLAAIDADESYPGGREGVIADARDTVLMFDEVWLCGGEITEGMKVEAQTAKVLRDLSYLGTFPPGSVPTTAPQKQLSNGKSKRRM